MGGFPFNAQHLRDKVLKGKDAVKAFQGRQGGLPSRSKATLRALQRASRT
jgi:hypothetical protein